MLEPRLHPYLAQNELRDYCARKGIVLSAYTPSGKPLSLHILILCLTNNLYPTRIEGYSFGRSDPLITSLAEKYNVTPTQVIFAWHIARGTAVVTKSEKSERQKENVTVSYPLLSKHIWLESYFAPFHL